MAGEKLWLFLVSLEDVPGSLLTLISAFANRAVSIRSILASGKQIAGEGIAALTFSCSEKRAKELGRVLRRLQGVRQVRVIKVPELTSWRACLAKLEGGAAPMENFLHVPVTSGLAFLGGEEKSWWNFGFWLAVFGR